MYMMCVNWSVSDKGYYLVYASSESEAERKVRSRWPRCQIMGTYKLESEIIR